MLAPTRSPVPAGGRRGEREGEALTDAAGGEIEVVALELAAEHGELVAAEAGRHVAGSHRAAEGLRDRDQHGIADRVPVGVVDLLEAVEVEEQHRGGPVTRRHVLLERLGEPDAVGQPGEAVDRRSLAQLGGGHVARSGHGEDAAGLEPAG